MLKITKLVKILLVLFILFLFLNGSVLATDINMNLALPTDDINSIDTNTSNDVGTAEGNEVDSIQDVLTNELNQDSQGSSDISGDAAPSGVSSIAQENMSFSNILNILIITVGVILILLAIAILIRLKG